MKTFLVIVITVVVTWAANSSINGIRTARERVWLISAVKAPGRMALSEIQTDLNAGRHAAAKAKMDILSDTWDRFDSGPDSFSGPGIGDIMVSFSKVAAGDKQNTNEPVR